MARMLHDCYLPKRTLPIGVAQETIRHTCATCGEHWHVTYYRNGHSQGTRQWPNLHFWRHWQWRRSVRRGEFDW